MGAGNNTPWLDVYQKSTVDRKGKSPALQRGLMNIGAGLGAVLWANELFSILKLFLTVCQNHQTDHHKTISYSIAGNLHYLPAGLFAARCGFGSCYCLKIVEPVSSVPSISRAGFRNLTPCKDRRETFPVFPPAYLSLKKENIFMRIRAKNIDVPI